MGCVGFFFLHCKREIANANAMVFISRIGSSILLRMHGVRLLTIGGMDGYCVPRLWLLVRVHHYQIWLGSLMVPVSSLH
jgi:hypothetical protein